MFVITVMWDDETREVSWYDLRQECKECKAISTAPTPIDWRDDLRTAYLLRIQGDKRNPTEIFPTLQNVFKKASNSDDPLQTLRVSAMFHYMLKSRNGDKLNL